MRSCFAVPVLARLAGVALASAALVTVAPPARGQIIPGPRWYRSATGMLGMSPVNVSAREMERLERYLVFGAAYCTGLTAPQYAANQAMVRNMGPYLASVGATAADMQARAAALRVSAAFSSFPCAFPGKQLPAMALPPPQPGDPPFAMRAPDLGKVPDEEQETAADLVVRYDTDVARSAATWKNAETLRLSLAARGMSLNAQTASGVSRLQPLYEEAATELRAHKWDDALSSLQAAEATTQKIGSTVGH